MDVLIDGAPTARRLQALAINGWGAEAIGQQIGMHYRNLIKVRSMKHPFVKTSTARKIATFYREHAMTRVETKLGRIAATRARNNGWRSGLEWADIDAGVLDEEEAA